MRNVLSILVTLQRAPRLRGYTEIIFEGIKYTTDCGLAVDKDKL